MQKYVTAPARLPDHVTWFKWEAYTTWLSGFALMLVLYYLEASSALVKPGDDLEPWLAVTISMGSSSSHGSHTTSSTGWSRTLGSCGPSSSCSSRSPRGGRPSSSSPRAAWLQVGAMIGTVMAANVLFDIIPAHRELIRAKEEGREPDPRPGIQAKQRSVQNNYLTLPVLLTMLAGHFPFAYGADHAWLVLVGLMAIGAWVRLFYNLRHQGRTHWWMAAVGAAAFVAIAVAVDRSSDTAAAPADAATIARGKQVYVTAGCGACHTLADAGSTAVVGPDLDAAAPSAALVEQRVRNGQGVMPAFAGTLSDEQIAAVAAYVSSVAGG